MSNDEQTKVLLETYVERAKALENGCNLSPETQAWFWGMTGRLLAHAVRSLWSQAELQQQIDARVAAKCETCHRAIASAKPVPEVTIKTVVLANFRFLAGCATTVVCLAIALNQLPALTASIKSLMN